VVVLVKAAVPEVRQQTALLVVPVVRRRPVVVVVLEPLALMQAVAQVVRVVKVSCFRSPLARA
jgi:hypothetical protein